MNVGLISLVIQTFPVSLKGDYGSLFWTLLSLMNNGVDGLMNILYRHCPLTISTRGNSHPSCAILFFLSGTRDPTLFPCRMLMPIFDVENDDAPYRRTLQYRIEKSRLILPSTPSHTHMYIPAIP